MLISGDIKWLLIASVGVNTLLIHSPSVEQTCVSEESGKDAVKTSTYVAEEEQSTGRSPASPREQGVGANQAPEHRLKTAKPGPLPSLASPALCLMQRQPGPPRAVPFGQGCCSPSPTDGINLAAGFGGHQ